nr:hypothetical protein [Bacteroidota bacterium]
MENQVQATWKGKGETITVNVPYILFEEDGFQIIYCPSLDISGYGVTETAAKESFRIVLHEYLTYTTKKGTLAIDLKKHGWKIIKRNLTKSHIPPDLSYTLSSNEDFRRIFDTHDFKKSDTEVVIPAI